MDTRSFRRHALASAAVLALALAGTAQAQLSTSTIQGQVAQGTVAAQAGVAVVAVNKDNGSSYRTVTRADGSYVLAGLPPGSYELRVGDRKSQVITVSVGETASVDLALAAATAPAGVGQEVVITGSISRKDVRNSEVGTSVSTKVIQNMPQSSRNFLSFADLAPGVRMDTDASGVVTLRGGAQDQNNVNIFIDGVSQKNNILRNGQHPAVAHAVAKLFAREGGDLAPFDI